MPEKDYSSRSLTDKLGIKAGASVASFGVKDFEGRARKDCDVVLLAVEKTADLGKIAKCQACLKVNGGLWIVYPKGRKDITQAQVMAAGLAAGLVDNKVVSFSATHTGLRFVVRLSDRVCYKSRGSHVSRPQSSGPIARSEGNDF